MMTQPKRGQQFYHARVLDPSTLPDKKPMLFEVTAIRGGCVYYRAAIYRENGRKDLGSAQYCTLEQFPKYVQEWVTPR